jgi:ribosomal protein S27E
MRRRFRDENEGVRGRLLTIVCPFCDHEIRSRGNVVRCLNCGGCFEREPDEEEFLFGTDSGF